MRYTPIVAAQDAAPLRESHRGPKLTPFQFGGRFPIARPVIRTVTVLAIAISAVLLADYASAALITLREGLDGYDHEDTFVRNDGTNGNATNTTTRTLAGSVGTSTPPGPLRAIFSFPLTGIPAGAVINSVTFSIGRDPDTGNSINADFTTELRTISTSFVGSTATWNNTFGGGMILGSTVLSSTTMNPEGPLSIHTFASSLDLVAAVQSALDGSQPFNFAVVAQPAVETGASRVIFRMGRSTSLLNPTDPQRPTLEIDYTVVPEPSAAALIGLAIGWSMCGIRSRCFRSAR